MSPGSCDLESMRLCLVRLRDGLAHSKAEFVILLGDRPDASETEKDKLAKLLMTVDPILTIREVLKEIKRIDPLADIDWAFNKNPTWDRTW